MFKLKPFSHFKMDGQMTIFAVFSNFTIFEMEEENLSHSNLGTF